MQNLDKQIIYSFTNNSYNPQLYTAFNVSPNVDAVVALDNTTVSTMSPLTLSAPINMNGNQLLQPNYYIHASEATVPKHTLQSMQDYRILAYPKKTAVISKYSFFNYIVKSNMRYQNDIWFVLKNFN